MAQAATGSMAQGGVAPSDDLVRRADAAPGGPAALELVEALAASGAWKEALDRARAAARAGADTVDGVLALARGALADSRLDRADKALEQLGRGGALPAHRRADVAAVAFAVRRRRDGDASAVAWLRAQVAAHPDDASLVSLGDRLAPDEARITGRLPLETLARARRLLAAGQPARALRLLRRLTLDHPDHPGVREVRLEAAGAVLDAGDAVHDVVAGVPLGEVDALYVDVEPLELA